MPKRRPFYSAQLCRGGSAVPRGRLRVAAATSVGEDGLRRALALVEAECDVVVVDSSHGHSRNVLDAIARINTLP